MKRKSDPDHPLLQTLKGSSLPSGGRSHTSLVCRALCHLAPVSTAASLALLALLPSQALSFSFTPDPCNTVLGWPLLALCPSPPLKD